MGNHLVRWAAVEAVQRLYGGAIGRTRAQLTERRGANIAKVASARKLLTLIYYGLRDERLRCLPDQRERPSGPAEASARPDHRQRS